MTTFNYVVQRQDKTSGAVDFLGYDSNDNVVFVTPVANGFQMTYDSSNPTSVHIYKTLCVAVAHIVWGNYAYSIFQV